MAKLSENPLSKLLEFVNHLDNKKIWHQLWHFRESIAVAVVVPGERWEVEFFEDGHVEVERFASLGVDTYDDEQLEALISEYGDDTNPK